VFWGSSKGTALCPYCGKALRTAKAQQCFHCGKDWHPSLTEDGRIAFHCPSCGKELKVKADMAGKDAKCLSCDGVLSVPVVAGAAALAEASLTDAADVAEAGGTKEESPEDKLAEVEERLAGLLKERSRRQLNAALAGLAVFAVGCVLLGLGLLWESSVLAVPGFLLWLGTIVAFTRGMGKAQPPDRAARKIGDLAKRKMALQEELGIQPPRVDRRSLIIMLTAVILLAAFTALLIYGSLYYN